MHTDDTHTDTPIPTHDPEDGTQPAPLIPPQTSRRSRRRMFAAATLAAVSVFAVALFASASDSSSRDTDEVASIDELAAETDLVPDVDVTTTVPDQPAEVDEDLPVPADPDPAGDPEPEPEPEPEPAGPCDLLAEGQTLAVSSESVELPVGQYAGELLVTNCGDQATPWNAHTLSPDVQLGVAAGMLAPGATVDVQFALDPSAILGSKLSFFITVSEPGVETKVMVTASKPIVNPGIELPAPELAP
ncbi:MAG: hypothetical protein ACXIVQ_03230 [Acidimicrobiales bacterium]